MDRVYDLLTTDSEIKTSHFPTQPRRADKEASLVGRFQCDGNYGTKVEIIDINISRKLTMTAKLRLHTPSSTTTFSFFSSIKLPASAISLSCPSKYQNSERTWGIMALIHACQITMKRCLFPWLLPCNFIRCAFDQTSPFDLPSIKLPRLLVLLVLRNLDLLPLLDELLLATPPGHKRTMLINQQATAAHMKPKLYLPRLAFLPTDR